MRCVSTVHPYSDRLPLPPQFGLVFTTVSRDRYHVKLDSHAMQKMIAHGVVVAPNCIFLLATAVIGRPGLLQWRQGLW